MVNSYKRNKATGKEVNSYLKNKELESHAAQMKQSDFLGHRRARMVKFMFIINP